MRETVDPVARAVPDERIPARVLFTRAAALRCPRCGARGIFRHWLKLREDCPGCALTLDRGESEDYWLGAYAFNLVAAELFTVLAMVIWVTAVWPAVPWTAVQWVAVLLAAGSPVAFFPFSRTLWLAWDLSFRPAEPGDGARGGGAGAAPTRSAAPTDA